MLVSGCPELLCQEPLRAGAIPAPELTGRQDAPLTDVVEEGSSDRTGSPAGALRAAHDVPPENFPRRKKKRVGYHELGSGWIDKNRMEPDSPFRSA